MAEIAPIGRTSVSRRRTAKPATVSASALADHLDCSRTYVSKLEAEGVIHRQGDGFQLGITVTVHLICRWRSAIECTVNGIPIGPSPGILPSDKALPSRVTLMLIGFLPPRRTVP
jgi:hypothetical protein